MYKSGDMLYTENIFIKCNSKHHTAFMKLELELSSLKVKWGNKQLFLRKACGLLRSNLEMSSFNLRPLSGRGPIGCSQKLFSTSLTSRGPITGQCVERGGRVLDWRVNAGCCTSRQDSRSSLPETRGIPFKTKALMYKILNTSSFTVSS